MPQRLLCATFVAFQLLTPSYVMADTPGISGNFSDGAVIIGPNTDACDNSIEGAIRYSSTTKAIAFCDGTTWKYFAQIQSASGPTAPSGSGYFVLTHTTWTGDLGGITGADAKCLTELSTTYTSWRGYATASSNGQLTGGKVHAFICDNSSCNNLMPLTTYYFSYANDASAGSASFTTDSSGLGPNDSASWAAANYFSGTYNYWTSAYAYGNDSAWSGDPMFDNCNNWTDATSGYSGIVGISGNINKARWTASYNTCNTASRLICFVNP